MDAVWETLHASREWGKYPSVDLVRTVMRGFQDRDKTSLRVLEIGCGAGANLFFFLREGFQVCGIDGAPSAVRKAGERLGGLKQPGQEFDLRVGDFQRLPWPAESFDLVVDYISICTNRMAEIRATLAECRRVLRPGGFMFSRAWSRGCLGDGTGNQIEPGTSDGPTAGPCENTGTSHFFSREELDELYAPFARRDLVQVTYDWKSREYRTIEWIVWAMK